MSNTKDSVYLKEQANAIYQRFMEACGVASLVDLAPIIRVEVQTLRQNKSEGRVPDHYFDRVANATGYEDRWLRTGHGPIKGEDRRIGQLPEPMQRLIEIMDGLETVLQTSVLGYALTLAQAEESDQTLLMAFTRLFQQLHDLRAQQEGGKS